jgi:GT2 family glycosyltransferase
MNEPIDVAPFSVIVTYHSNIQCLVSIFNSLQSQLLPPRRIIIIDTSANKSGLDVAQRFSTGDIDVVVECAQVGIHEAWNRGIELAGYDDVLICNDDLLLPVNTTDIFTIAREAIPALIYVPVTPPREHYSDYVDLPFSWFAKVPSETSDFSVAEWMPGFCFYLTREAIKEIGLFDTNLKVWFGDDDYQSRVYEYAKDFAPIIRLDTCFVYHFGGKSYKYQSKEIQELIEKDREYFAKKYGVLEEDLLDVAK